MRRISGLGAAVIVAIVCRPAGVHTQPTPPPPHPSDFEHDMLVRFHMHENYDLARATERLLLRGKLDDARALAAGIASAPDEAGDPRWTAHGSRVREAAAQIVRATTIADACHREAGLAAACAGCHVETGASPEFTTSSKAPPDEATVPARMLRHQWAAARLWEGLLGDSDESWRAGLQVLASTPLDDSADPRLAARRDLGRQLQHLAGDARTKTARPDAKTYGDILATCAACHVSVGRP